MAPVGQINFLGLGATLLVATALMVVFNKIQKASLKLQPIDTTGITKESLDQIIKKVANDLRWRIKTHNDKLLIAKKNANPLINRWGDQITIIYTKNKIYANCISDPDGNGEANRSGQNIRRLIQEINQAGGPFRYM